MAPVPHIPPPFALRAFRRAQSLTPLVGALSRSMPPQLDPWRQGLGHGGRGGECTRCLGPVLEGALCLVVVAFWVAAASDGKRGGADVISSSVYYYRSIKCLTDPNHRRHTGNGSSSTYDGRRQQQEQLGHRKRKGGEAGRQERQERWLACPPPPSPSRRVRAQRDAMRCWCGWVGELVDRSIGRVAHAPQSTSTCERPPHSPLPPPSTPDSVAFDRFLPPPLPHHPPCPFPLTTTHHQGGSARSGPRRSSPCRRSSTRGRCTTARSRTSSGPGSTSTSTRE